MSRELPRQERTAIRSLVIKWCANYSKEYGCLLLDGGCYMLGKCWTGAYCRYFREAVQPLDSALEAALTSVGPAPGTRHCPVCGAGLSPGWTAAVLFPGLRRSCFAPAKAGLYATQAEVICGKSGSKKRPYSNAFWGRFQGGWYATITRPHFAQILSTLLKGECPWKSKSRWIRCR